MLFDTVFVQRFEKKALLLRFYTSLFDFKLYCTDSLTWPSLIGFQFVSVPAPLTVILRCDAGMSCCSLEKTDT